MKIETQDHEGAQRCDAFPAYGALFRVTGTSS